MEDIIYSTHVQDDGWLHNVSNGEVSGTTGQGKRMEAIKIDLTGEIANHSMFIIVFTQKLWLVRLGKKW